MENTNTSKKPTYREEVHTLNKTLDSIFGEGNKLENVDPQMLKDTVERAVHFSKGAMIADQVVERIGTDLAKQVGAEITFNYKNPRHWAREAARGVGFVAGAAVTATAINYGLRGIAKYRGTKAPAINANPFADSTAARPARGPRRSEGASEGASLH